MPRIIAFLLLCPLLALAPTASRAQQLIDRVVAVVDEESILQSDIRRVIGLELYEAVPGESEAQLERRILDGLIDHSLRLREVERHDFGQLPTDEIDRQVERIRSRFGNAAELEERLRSLGLDDEGLRLLVTRQLRVLIYVEKRLGPRVFINPDDIRDYYRDVLSVEMRDQGLETPPLSEVREQIRELLHELELNAQIEAWTEELRLAADIVDYLDRRLEALPPVLQRIELDR
ncbi:MAG: hypothetical protein AAF560_26845 [Acidobacteriota bacterium]